MAYLLCKIANITVHYPSVQPKSSKRSFIFWRIQNYMPHGLELGALSLISFKPFNLHLQPFISSPSHRPGPLANLGPPPPAR